MTGLIIVAIRVALLLLTLCRLEAQCRMEIGVVKQFLGTWKDQSDKRILRAGDIICANSRIVRIDNYSATENDFLQLTARSSANKPVTYACRDSLGCEKPLDLRLLVNKEQQRLKGDNFFPSFSEWRLSHAVSVITRGVPPTGAVIQQAIVVEAGKPIPASAVFKSSAQHGNFQFDLCLGATDEACGKTLPTAKLFAWNSKADLTLPFGAMPPGVHLLYRMDPADPEMRTEDRALIVAVAGTTKMLEAQDMVALALLDLHPNDAHDAALFEAYVRELAAKLQTR